MSIIHKNMPFFYDKHKWLMIITNLGLSLPLIIIGSIDAIEIYAARHDGDFYKWLQKYKVANTIFDFIVGNVICISM